VDTLDKNIRKVLGGQKAVSLVLSVMLLVIITVVVGIFFYTFVTGMLGNIMTPTSSQPFSLRIDNVAINDTCMTIYIRNSSDQDASIQTVYVNSEPRAFLGMAGNEGVILRDSTGKIQVPGSYSSGSRYEIKVVFASGYTLYAMESY
jgi:FlaG/FlaF family flagellin (archaellin)